MSYYSPPPPPPPPPSFSLLLGSCLSTYVGVCVCISMWTCSCIACTAQGADNACSSYSRNKAVLGEPCLHNSTDTGRGVLFILCFLFVVMLVRVDRQAFRQPYLPTDLLETACIALSGPPLTPYPGPFPTPRPQSIAVTHMDNEQDAESARVRHGGA
ncbi:hypothetical protein BD289DRAFT_278093 [Coniella lustricola]|uniref:Uncharacterized protein n=1 Tax=Coniella lustricola TaxID=2025994 RepID=A0A2T3A6C1_9PEZI|nr:hypothetical protein BD289DRAFT_278093 [Coniella lustricola]